jgi:WD40 repeat protein
MNSNRVSRLQTAALALTLFTCAVVEGNDLLAINNAGSSSAVLRYNEDTGAFVGKFSSFSGIGYSMTFGPDGNLYVGTSNNISRYDGQSGALLNVFVPTTNGTTNPIPLDMTFGPDGNLYVTGGGNKPVWRYNGITGQFINAFTTTSTFGSQPGGLTFGADGNLYVADGFNVDRYNTTTGAFMNHFAGGGSGLERAGEVRFGPDGNLYVVGNSLLKFNGKTGAFNSNLFLIGSENFAFGLDGNIYASGFPGIDRYNTSGTLLNNFVPRNSGGLSSPGAIVFVPEPGTTLVMVSLSMIFRRRRPVVGNAHPTYPPSANRPS